MKNEQREMEDIPIETTRKTLIKIPMDSHRSGMDSFRKDIDSNRNGLNFQRNGMDSHRNGSIENGFASINHNNNVNNKIKIFGNELLLS